MFYFCLIVNYVVALHRTCYTIDCIVPWYPAVYKTSTTSIQSVGFTVTEIPFCFSERLIYFACEILRATKSAWDFFGANFRSFLVPGFFWVLLEALGIFSIRSSPSLEIPSTPPGAKPTLVSPLFHWLFMWKGYFESIC